MAIVITVDSNYDQISADINRTLRNLIENQEPFLLAIASSVLAGVHYRIHTLGKRANGSDIGTYSNQYLKTRERFNRGSDKRIILSLHRQMELDFTVVAKGQSIGLGFLNSTNFEKATALEKRYPGTYALSDEEEEIVANAITDYLNGIFN